jgi:NADH-quinone oxidoreductase subunit K
MILSGMLFVIGVIGALTRRNAIVVFMCIELMLNAVNLTFITLSHHLQSMEGILFAFSSWRLPQQRPPWGWRSS